MRRGRRGHHDHRRAQEERGLLRAVLRRDAGAAGQEGSSIANLAGAKGHKIGAQTQTTGEEFATKQGLNPVSFESSDALLNGLRTGQVEAVITDYPVVAGWLKKPDLAAEFEVKDNLKTNEQYGIMVRKGNTKLVAALNKAIEEMKADGSYKASYEKWIGPYVPATTATK